MTTPKTILARILFLLYLGAIALLCFMHVDKLPDVQKFIFGIPTDKIVHFGMFLPFPILASTMNTKTLLMQMASASALKSAISIER